MFSTLINKALLENKARRAAQSKRIVFRLALLFVIIGVALLIVGTILISDSSSNYSSSITGIFSKYMTSTEESEYSATIKSFTSAGYPILQRTTATFNNRSLILSNASRTEFDYNLDLVVDYTPRYFTFPYSAGFNQIIYLKYLDVVSVIPIPAVLSFVPFAIPKSLAGCTDTSCNTICNTSYSGTYNGTHCIGTVQLDRLCFSVGLTSDNTFVLQNSYADNVGCYYYPYRNSFSVNKPKFQQVLKALGAFYHGNYVDGTPSSRTLEIRLLNDPRIKAESILSGDFSQKYPYRTTVSTSSSRGSPAVGIILVTLGSAFVLVGLFLLIAYCILRRIPAFQNHNINFAIHHPGTQTNANPHTSLYAPTQNQVYYPHPMQQPIGTYNLSPTMDVNVPMQPYYPLMQQPMIANAPPPMYPAPKDHMNNQPFPANPNPQNPQPYYISPSPEPFRNSYYASSSSANPSAAVTSVPPPDYSSDVKRPM